MIMPINNAQRGGGGESILSKPNLRASQIMVIIDLERYKITKFNQKLLERTSVLVFLEKEMKTNSGNFFFCLSPFDRRTRVEVSPLKIGKRWKICVEFEQKV